MQDRAEEGEDLSALKRSNNKFTNILLRSGPRAEHKSLECQGHPFTKRHGIHIFQGLITAEHFIKHFILRVSHSLSHINTHIRSSSLNLFNKSTKQFLT